MPEFPARAPLGASYCKIFGAFLAESGEDDAVDLFHNGFHRPTQYYPTAARYAILRRFLERQDLIE